MAEATKDPEQEQIEKEAQQTGQPVWVIVAQRRYGYLAAFINDPELGDLLKRAGEGGWTKETLQGELYKTDWWKKNSESLRQWQLLESSDPATAKARVNAQYGNLRLIADQMGFKISDEAIRSVAKASMTMGLDEGLAKQMLFAQARFSPRGNVHGIAGSYIDQVKARAAAYGLPISEEKAFGYAKRIAMGSYTAEGVDVDLRQQARGSWSYLSDDLDRGFTVKEVLDPYIQQWSQLMEKPATEVDLADAKFRRFVEGKNDKGHRQLLSLTESADRVRQTDSWLKTKNATDQASALSESLLAQFGKVAR